ncbi:MAG: two-component system regulatory protein YycI [Lysinibacillus sp.]
MDWSKTKSIFIVIFLILNIFLYYQYIEKYKGAELDTLPGEAGIEEKLQKDNITYDELPQTTEPAVYLTAKVKSYSLDSLPNDSNKSYRLDSDDELVVNFKTPLKLLSGKKPEALKEFVSQHVYEGSSFVLWEVDEAARTATFFQRVNDRPLYYNRKGKVKVYWNSSNEVFMYEMAMFEKIEKLKAQNQKKIVPALQILQILYNQQLLQIDDHIASMKLGYANAPQLQLTQTQVFTPTWEVHVEAVDGKEELYFVDAIGGTVMEILPDLQEAVEE